MPPDSPLPLVVNNFQANWDTTCVELQIRPATKHLKKANDDTKKFKKIDKMQKSYLSTNPFIKAVFESTTKTNDTVVEDKGKLPVASLNSSLRTATRSTANDRARG